MERVRTYAREHPKAVGIGLITAAVAGLAVAVIIVISGLSGEVADSDPSPAASPTGAPAPPSASAKASEPEPSASHATWHGYALTDIETPLFRSVWARVAVDAVNVRAAPGTSAQIVGSLRHGDLVQVMGDPDTDQDILWYPVVGDGLAGWVAHGDGEDEFLQPIATPWLFGSNRTLSGVAASGERVLAHGWASDLVVPPYEGTGTRGLVYVSDIGDTWKELEIGHGPAALAAGGNGGFVLVSVPSYLGPTVVRTSPDGVTWDDGVPVDGDPIAAAWGPAGPVVTTSVYQVGRSVLRVHDGSTSEVLRLGDWSNPNVEASDEAYVIFEPFGATEIFVSRDGETWEPSVVPGTDHVVSRVRDVEVFGDALVVVITDSETGRTGIAHGRLGSDDSPVIWSAERTTPFGTATVDSIAAGDGVLLALGWNREILEPMVWRSTDGRTWTNLDVDPRTFGGAIGPEPVFAGDEWFAVTDAVYASTDGAAWRVAYEVPGEAVKGPGCPPADEVLAIDLAFLGPFADDCFEESSLTFRAWTPLIEGLGGCCWPVGLPEWLAAPIPPALLMAAPSGFTGRFDVGGFAAYLSPTIDGMYQPDAWAEITGHFHDPASAECRYVPLTYMPHRLQSKADAVATCAARYVVDQIVPAEGP